MPAGWVLRRWRRAKEGLSKDGGGSRQHFLTHEKVQVQVGIFQIQFQKFVY